MLFLIVAAAAVPLLYVWLIGHWFARVLVFLVLAVVMGAIGAVIAPPGPNIMTTLIGVALAWPLASIPIYIHRHKARSTSMEMALR